MTDIILADDDGQNVIAMDRENGLSLAASKDVLLRLAASLEQLSTHILAQAVVDAAQQHGLALSLVSDFEESFGKGVRGRVPMRTAIASTRPTEEPCAQTDLAEVAVGNRTFMKHFGVRIPQRLLIEREQRVELQPKSCRVIFSSSGKCSRFFV